MCGGVPALQADLDDHVHGYLALQLPWVDVTQVAPAASYHGCWLYQAWQRTLPCGSVHIVYTGCTLARAGTGCGGHSLPVWLLLPAGTLRFIEMRHYCDYFQAHC